VNLNNFVSLHRKRSGLGGVKYGITIFLILNVLSMKAKMSLLTFLMFAVTSIMYAQGGGFQMPSAEERTKSTMEKLADLKLDKDQTTKTDTIFANFYRAQAKKFEEMRAGGGQPDREAMRAEMEKMNADRDDKLKKVFSADQFKKFKDEIEPTLRQRRGGGGGGR
jgi:periplasmic protein CpxP/Spy